MVSATSLKELEATMRSTALRQIQNGVHIGALAMVALGFACSSPSREASSEAEVAAPIGLDVNDVSWLFPLTDAKTNVAPKKVVAEKLLHATSKHPDGSELLPAALHSAFVELLTGNDERVVKKALVFLKNKAPSERDFEQRFFTHPDPAFDRSQWGVVAARLDSCAPGDAVACGPQVRLVLQRILGSDGTDNGSATTDDRAIHLVYGFEKAEFATLMADYMRIRKPAPGLPLGVHPVMEKEGVEGPTVAAYGAFLLKKLHPSKLKAFALFSRVSDRIEVLPKWFFMGGVFVQGQPRVIAQVFPPARGDNSGTPQLAIAQRVQLGLSNIEPRFFGTRRSLVPQRISVLRKEGWKDEQNDKFDVPAPLDRSVVSQINNPHLSMLLVQEQERDDGPGKVAHVDCASCHGTTQIRSIALEEDPKALAEITSSSDRMQIPAGLTAAVVGNHLQGGAQQALARDENLRNFGYFQDIPSVAERTLMETLLVAASLNKTLNLAAPRGNQVCDAQAIRACQFQSTDATCIATLCK
jgi:hypothetical protein